MIGIAAFGMIGGAHLWWTPWRGSERKELKAKS